MQAFLWQFLLNKTSDLQSFNTERGRAAKRGHSDRGDAEKLFKLFTLREVPPARPAVMREKDKYTCTFAHT